MGLGKAFGRRDRRPILAANHQLAWRAKLLRRTARRLALVQPKAIGLAGRAPEAQAGILPPLDAAQHPRPERRKQPPAIANADIGPEFDNRDPGQELACLLRTVRLHHSPALAKTIVLDCRQITSRGQSAIAQLDRSPEKPTADSNI